jgi:uncharacterized protein
VNLPDSGPLVAIADKNDPDHARCVAATRTLPKLPLLTTWPCFTEAMYLLYRDGGFRSQDALWQLRRSGALSLYTLTDSDADRMETLMHRYRDTPMDLADASVVAAAESLKLTRVFTIDSHFQIYRIHGTRPFEIVP